MNKLPTSKTNICTGLLCLMLLSEMTVLGNAFVFYTGLSRYFIFFICAGMALLIAYPYKFKSFNQFGVVLCILVFAALASDLLFSLAHQLYVVKMLAIIAIAHLCIRDYKFLRQSLGRTFLHLSNIGILLGLSAILLPDSFIFNSGYIDELRRQGEGFGGTFYWSQNFSGLFLIGDEGNPVPFLAEIPRYAGYTNEPAINGFLICLSIALLYDTGYKFTTPVIVLTLINFLITFSVASFLIFASLYTFWKLIKLNMMSSLVFITSISIIGIFLTPILFSTEYLQIKLGNSLGSSVYIWEAIFQSKPLNISSLNARVGDFSIDNINSISAILWLSLLIYILMLFTLRLFLPVNLKSFNGTQILERSRDLWVIVLIGFSFKTMAHTLFMPIFFVLIAELMLSDSQRSLKNLQ